MCSTMTIYAECLIYETNNTTLKLSLTVLDPKTPSCKDTPGTELESLLVESRYRGKGRIHSRNKEAVACSGSDEMILSAFHAFVDSGLSCTVPEGEGCCLELYRVEVRV